MARKNKDFISSEQRDYKNKIKELKTIIRRLQSDKRQLISELQGYKEAFNESIEELSKKIKNKPVEQLIHEVNGKWVGRTKRSKKNTKQSIKDKDKWVCHECNDGHMVIIKYRKAGGTEYYHRSCSAPTCSNRTLSKVWHEEVEGVLSND